MAATITKTSICNLALGWLRANLIANYDTDVSVEAKLCRANYDRLREAVLEEKEWRFATGRVKLALSASTPVFGYSHKFSIPPEVIRVLSCSRDASVGNTDNDIEWEREGDFVMAYREMLYSRCTFNIEATTQFSPGFVQAFATRLAAELAVPLTGSNKRHVELMQDYVLKVNAGGTKDGMQGRAKKRRAGRLETARHRGGGGFDVITE